MKTVISLVIITLNSTLSLSSLNVYSSKWTSMNYLFFKISILHKLELMDIEFPF